VPARTVCNQSRVYEKQGVPCDAEIWETVPKTQDLHF
jgi:hypothetical protein